MSSLVNGEMKSYLATSFVIMEVHQIADVFRLFLGGLFRGVDELPGELNSVSNIVPVFKK